MRRQVTAGERATPCERHEDGELVRLVEVHAHACAQFRADARHAGCDDVLDGRAFSPHRVRTQHGMGGPGPGRDAKARPGTPMEVLLDADGRDLVEVMKRDERALHDVARKAVARDDGVDGLQLARVDKPRVEERRRRHLDLHDAPALGEEAALHERRLDLHADVGEERRVDVDEVVPLGGPRDVRPSRETNAERLPRSHHRGEDRLENEGDGARGLHDELVVAPDGRPGTKLHLRRAHVRPEDLAVADLGERADGGQVPRLQARLFPVRAHVHDPHGRPRRCGQGQRDPGDLTAPHRAVDHLHKAGTLSTRVKVTHVVQRFHPEVGGAETHVRALARHQAKRGHDVTVVTSQPVHRAAPVEERLEGYRVLRLPVRRFKGDYLFPPWLTMAGATDALAADPPDLFHAHSYRFHTLEAAAEASRRTGRPFVVTAHGFYPPENALVAWSRRRYDAARGGPALRAASRCVAVTGHEVAHYEALGVPRDRIDVVPNGIDRDALEPGDGEGFRKRHGLEGPLVVFLARLAHDKGVADLARAARGLDATVAICGRDAGAGRAAMRQAPPNVRFLGPVPDPRDAYAAADVFCLPSHYEAFGLVLIEAMAQGTPVVATTAGGMPEVVGDAGVLAPPRDPSALREALRDLLADAPGREAMGERARTRAGSFLWEDVVARLEETYHRAQGR